VDHEEIYARAVPIPQRLRNSKLGEVSNIFSLRIVTRPRAPTLERDLIEQALQKLFDNQKQIFLVELTTTLSPSYNIVIGPTSGLRKWLGFLVNVPFWSALEIVTTSVTEPPSLL